MTNKQINTRQITETFAKMQRAAVVAEFGWMSNQVSVYSECVLVIQNTIAEIDKLTKEEMIYGKEQTKKHESGQED